MKTVKAQWNSGNFSLKHEAEVTDEQYAVLADRGLLWEMQRNREHDIVIGTYKKVGKKRVKVCTRIEVPYSDDLAVKLNAVYGAAEIAEGMSIAINTVITEYQRETAALMYRDAKAVLVRHESANDLEAWAKAKFGFAGETHGEDGEYSPELLAATHAFLKTLLQDV